LKAAVNKKELLAHIFFWVLYIAWAQKQILSDLDVDAIYPFWTILLNYVTELSIVYFVACIVLPVLHKKKKIVAGIALGLFCLAAYMIIIYLLETRVEPYIYKTPAVDFSFSEVVNGLSWRFLKFLFFGIAYYFLKEAFRLEREKHIAAKEKINQQLQLEEARRQVMEKEKLALENAALRAKINPHLLFNTLAVFRNSLLRSDQEAAKAMLDFSEMMRYTTSTEGPDGLVPVTEELQNIKRLINVHQYQFNHKLQIKYTEEGQLGGRIPAQVFITLVENGFKYGQLYDPENPLTIHLKISEENILSFSLQNKKRTDTVLPGGGIGMEYIRNRLQQVYGNDFTLHIENGPDHYAVQVIIEI
jgi:two-component system, LytTR family, sensor kinase